MRILHLSDLHIGKRVNEFPMLDDQRHILAQVLDLARERAVDAIVVAGDLYDKASPSAEAVALLDWFLAEASRTGAALLAIPGNHDAEERIAYASTLLARQNIHLAPVYDGSVAHVDLEDEHGTVTFWLIPFLKPSMVRPHVPDARIESYTDALRTVLERCPIDPARRNVAVSHQFVTCTGQATERTESELVLGGMDNVDVGAYDVFDYVALGHVHRPQRVGRDEVRYSGSPLKYSFSEIDGCKSVPLVELGAKGDPVAIDLVRLEPLHDMRRVRGPLEKLVSPSVAAQADPNDYLRVTLTDEHPPLDALQLLRSTYPNVMGVEYESGRTAAAGCPAGATSDRPRTPLELFEAFYLLQNGVELTESQRDVVLKTLEQTQAV